MKAATQRVVTVQEKYRRLPWLHVVYAWHVREPARARFFCLSPSEALDLAVGLEWTNTLAWTRDGRYTTNNHFGRVLDAVAMYEMRTPADWMRKVRTREV